MPAVKITETVLRDAHQSLLATRMRLADMLPICQKLDQVGYWSLECWGGATYDACLRFLKEDPWQRLRQLREALPNSRTQMLLRGQNLLGYRHYSDDVVQKFVQLAANNGMDVFRIFDAMNDVRNLHTAIDAVKKAGKHAQGTICYTLSPVHTTEQFVTMAKALENRGCDSVVVKDMAGLLTPSAAANLMQQLTLAVSVPIHLHSHATSGLADMAQLKAIENGCYHIDTAISSMANGASHPPTESMVAALADSEYTTGLDLPLLQEIGFYFKEIRKKYHQFESEFTGIDTRVHVNQVPGGMISNLANQLKEQNATERMNEVLAEIPKVRADLGYPPLVTPTSQIVGSQAVFNVLSGGRYNNISNEVKLYFQGRYGRAPGTVSEKIRQLAIGNEEVIEVRPADLLPPEWDKLERSAGENAQCEEDAMIVAMFPDLGLSFLEEREEGTLTPESLEPISNGEPASTAPVEFTLTLHGENYDVKVTGSGHESDGHRPVYLTLDGVPEEVLVETHAEMMMGGGAVSSSPTSSSGRQRATEPGHVTTSMPGTVIEVLVKEGDQVSEGQPVLITEAMKMESEIAAPIAGVVKGIYVQKGESVNPDEVLLEIETD
ncbi:MAG: sodium-extruding oxaloacetate decarboxylase subunit alpha [Gammaproteobacteria bacterium]|nr:sodium-extruding oxaloacetate decarboxylase subunit alpha [Gammaproteobacteria bacterium]